MWHLVGWGGGWPSVSLARNDARVPTDTDPAPHGHPDRPLNAIGFDQLDDSMAALQTRSNVPAPRPWLALCLFREEATGDRETSLYVGALSPLSTRVRT